jgi:hypothetical protein
MWLFLFARFVLQASPADLTDADVARVVGANLRAIKGCWALERRGDAEAGGGGKVILTLDVAPSGTVSEARVASAPFASPAFYACLRGRARSWTFPRFRIGPRRFSVPLVFMGP